MQQGGLMGDHNNCDMRSALYKSEHSGTPVLSPGVGIEVRMSRRKQSKPRHVEADDDDTTCPEPDQSESLVCEEEDEFEEGEDEDHACGHCEQRFLSLEQLFEHRRHCYNKPLLLAYGGDGKEKTVDEEVDELEEEDVSRLMIAHLAKTQNMEMQPLLMNQRPPMSDSHMTDKNLISEEEEENQRSPDSVDELDDEPMDIEKSESSPNTSNEEETPGMPVLASMFNDTNVKLQSLMNTKVAVAQFAENNIAPADLAVLQTTLYSLQQQQIFQFQLLQQLQTQLMARLAAAAAGENGGDVAGGLAALALPNMAAGMMAGLTGMMPGMMPLPAPTEQSNSGSDSEMPSKTNIHDNNNVTKNFLKSPMTAPSNAHTSTVSSTGTIPTPTQPPSTPPTGKSSIAPLMAQMNDLATGSPNFPTGPTDLSKLAHFQKGKPPNVTVGGTMLERTQYAAEDPFFKHKCRFCHKVFGSDSALQIHIRSHTGERPFKCNICGNRFSTKGNLKVHFVRHKDTHPDVEMSCIPIPEYMDQEERPPVPPMLVPAVPPPPNMHRPPMMGPPIMPCPPMIKEEKSTPLKDDNSSSQPKEREEADLNSHISSNENRSPPFSGIVSPHGSRYSSSPESVISQEGNMQSAPASGPGTPIPPQMVNLPGVMPNHMLPMSPFPMPTSLPQGIISPFNMEPPFFKRPSMLPPQTEEDPMEQYMECQKSETSKLEQLVKNIESKLSDPNQCAICHRILSCKSALQMHYRTHTGERPFKCKICGRAFTTKGNLKTHMGVHRAKPPMRMLHQCPVCHKQFTNAMVLQQHIRMHTGELPKEFPMPPPGDMMPMGGMNPYMPFPHFPFLPPGMPGLPIPSQPPRMPGTGLDLSKHTGERNVDRKDAMQPNERHEQPPHELYKRELFEPEKEQEKAENLSKTAENINTEIMKDDKMQSENADKELALHGADREDDFPRDGEPDAKRHCSGPGPNSPLTPEMSSRNSPSRSSSVDSHQESLPQDSPASNKILTPPPVPKFPAHTPGRSQEPYLLYNYPGSHPNSLMALEERVNAIETSAAPPFNMGRPLEQIENILRRTDWQSGFGVMPMLNGAAPKSISPRDTEAVSDDRATPIKMTSPMGSDGGNSGEGSPGVQFKPFSPFSMLDNHDSKLNTTCDICFKTFACKSALEIHYRSHTKERPYKCDACDRSFTTRGNMRQHMLTHKIRDLPSEAFKQHENNAASSESADSSEAVTKGDMKPQASPTSSDAPPFAHPNAPHDGSPGKNISGPPSELSSVRPIGPLGGYPGGYLSGHPIGRLNVPPSGSPGGRPNVPPTLPSNGPPSGPLRGPPNDPLRGPPSDPRGPPSDQRGPTSDPLRGLPNDPRGPPNDSLRGIPSDPRGPTNDPLRGPTNEPPNGPPSGPPTPIVVQPSSIPMSMNSPTSQPQMSSEGGQSPFVRRPNPKHICHVCTKPFSSGSALQIHMRTHTGDKPFKCTVCGKAFTTKGNLKVHMGTHMWNNSPSRRGRRMSVEAIPNFPSPKDAEFFNAFAHRSPSDLYPFPFHGFPNGFNSPKMNEISVIQSLNGGMPHMPPSSMAEAMMAAHLPGAPDMAKRPMPPPMILKSDPATALKSEDSQKEREESRVMQTGGMPHMPPSSMAEAMLAAHLPGAPDMGKRPMPPPMILKSDHAAALKSEDRQTEREESQSPAERDTVPSNKSTPPPANGSSGELDLSIRKSPAASPPVTSAAPMRPPPLPHSQPQHISSPLLPTVVSSMNMHMPPNPQHPLVSASMIPQHLHPSSPHNSWLLWKTTCHLCNKECTSPAALENHLKSHMHRAEEPNQPKTLVA